MQHIFVAVIISSITTTMKYPPYFTAIHKLELILLQMAATENSLNAERSNIYVYQKSDDTQITDLWAGFPGWFYDDLFLVCSYIDNTDYKCRRKLRMGKVGDGGWEVCDDIEFRPMKPCLVYSFG